MPDSPQPPALLRRLEKNALIILCVMILLFVALVSGLLWFKYNQFGFDAIDLSIYNQVFHNTAEGRLFEFSIHPHLYLGDHMELFILILAPLYMLNPSPVTLLVLQAIALGVSALPLFLIARQFVRKSLALLVSAAFLLSPFVWNMAFFEFHMLPFAIPLLLWALYFFLKKNLAGFLILITCSLLVREDIPLVVVMFGVLAWIERRSWKWKLTPLILGGTWFVAATGLTSYWSGYDSYKFFALYSWLGSNVPDMLNTILFRPWIVWGHILSLNNLLLVLGLLLPLAFLPLWGQRYLLLGGLVFVQLFLSSVSSTVVLQTHYTALLLPFAFVAAAYGMRSLQRLRWSRLKIFSLIRNNSGISLILLSAAIVYSLATFSPLFPVLAATAHTPSQPPLETKHTLLESVPDQAAVVSSFDYLPHLSGRTGLYSLHYSFLGKQQYSDKPYSIPEPLDAAVVDFRDFMIYAVQSKNQSVYRENYAAGHTRIQNLLNANSLQLAAIDGATALYMRQPPSPKTLVAFPKTVPLGSTLIQNPVQTDVQLLGGRFGLPEKDALLDAEQLPVSLYWKSSQPIGPDANLIAALTLYDAQDNAILRQEFVPLGYGLYPAHTWAPQQLVQTNHWFALPSDVSPESVQLHLEILSIKGYMGLDGLRSTDIKITEQQRVGDPVVLDYSTS